MFDSNVCINKINQYYKQVYMLICNESVFSFGNKRIVKRSRINDILCCSKNNFPEEYWRYVNRIKKSDNRVLPKSYNLFLYFEFLITRKFWFFSEYCIVNIDEVQQHTRTLLKELKIDFDRILFECRET